MTSLRVADRTSVRIRILNDAPTPGNFCIRHAGGSIEAGETDECSYNGVTERVHMNEINATIIALSRHQPRTVHRLLPGH